MRLVASVMIRPDTEWFRIKSVFIFTGREDEDRRQRAAEELERIAESTCLRLGLEWGDEIDPDDVTIVEWRPPATPPEEHIL